MKSEAKDTAPALVAEQAARAPDGAALIYQGATTTFSELDALGRRAAKGLAALGVGAGDRVAFWLPNTPAYAALWLGCARLGAIAVAVNTRFRSAEVGDIVSRSGARRLVMWPGFRGIDFLGILSEVDRAALAGLETLILYDEDGIERSLPEAAAHCRQVSCASLLAQGEDTVDRAVPDGPLNIFTTSGTTKAPKFVLHGNGGLVRHARIVAREFGYDRGGAMLMSLPLGGVFGFCQFTACLAAGAPLVLNASFDAAESLELIARHDVRHLNATDDMIDALLRLSPDADVLPSIDFCGYAIFNSHLSDIIETAAARGLTLIGLYGMSEVQALFAIQDAAAPIPERRLGGGRLLSPEYAVRVRDPESGELLGFGARGELELKGPSLMLGYYDNPQATAETLTEDGYVRSGDLGYLVADDHFVYVSRMGDVLRLGGFLVSPAEIEDYLLGHPSVEGAQVVGADTDAGIRPVGFVMPAAGKPFDEAAVLDYCRQGLARFKVPLRIFPVDAFPTTKSANGTKIQRGRLRDMAAARLAQAAPHAATGD